jgi:hypothetical protein
VKHTRAGFLIDSTLLAANTSTLVRHSPWATKTSLFVYGLVYPMINKSSTSRKSSFSSMTLVIKGAGVNGASALLHLVIASLKYEKSTPIGYKFLSDIDDLRKIGPQYRADSAIRALIDQDNMDLPILPGKKKFVKESTSGTFNQLDEKDKIEKSNISFSDRVEQVIDYLDKAFIYQEDKMYRPGHKVKLPSRQLLEGFDFAEIAESQSSVPLRIAELKTAGKGWIDFVRKIKAVNLFGRGFGDIISPTNVPCESWRRMPTGEDYLAVGVQDLNKIINRFGIRGQVGMQVVSGIFWHMPDKIFYKCTCQDRILAPCDRTQVLLPDKFKFRRFTKCIVPPETLDGKEEGAVIFGYSKKSPVNWPEDPEEIAQEGRVTPDTSETKTSSSLTLLTSIRLGSGRTVDHLESSSSGLSSSQEMSQATLSDITIPDPSNDQDGSDSNRKGKERQREP